MTPQQYFELISRSLIEVLDVSRDTAAAMMKELKDNVPQPEELQDTTGLDSPLYIACDLAKVDHISERLVEKYLAIKEEVDPTKILATADIEQEEALRVEQAEFTSADIEYPEIEAE